MGLKSSDLTAKRPKIYTVFCAPLKINQSLSTIFQRTRSLPFSPRWFTIPDTIFQRLLSLNAMRGYPVLVDSKNGAVAQAEHTIIVTKDGSEITTIKN